MGAGRILLADDSRALEHHVEHLIDQSYAVTAVGRPRECLLEAQNAIEAHAPFDLFVIDIHYAGARYPDEPKNGIELAAALRRIAPGTPIVGMTGRQASLSTDEMKGFDAFLLKTFLPEDLEGTIAALRRRKVELKWLPDVLDLSVRNGRIAASSLNIEAQSETGRAELGPDVHAFFEGTVDENAVRRIGHLLRERLRAGTVSTALAAHRLLCASSDVRGRVVLSGAGEAWDWPWELCAIEPITRGAGESALWNDSRLVPSRSHAGVRFDLPEVELKAPLKLLVVAPESDDLDVAAELDAIAQSLPAPLVTRRRLLCSERWADKGQWSYAGPATVDAVRTELREEKPQIVHFVGHGGRGHLRLDNRNWESYFLDLDLRGGSVELLVLNCCYSASADTNPGNFRPMAVAQAASHGGVRAVVGHLCPPRDVAARSFAADFYAALARGFPVDVALNRSRRDRMVAELEARAAFLPVLLVQDRFVRFST